MNVTEAVSKAMQEVRKDYKDIHSRDDKDIIIDRYIEKEFKKVQSNRFTFIYVVWYNELNKLKEKELIQYEYSRN